MPFSVSVRVRVFLVLVYLISLQPRVDSELASFTPKGYRAGDQTKISSTIIGDNIVCDNIVLWFVTACRRLICSHCTEAPAWALRYTKASGSSEQELGLLGPPAHCLLQRKRQ